MRIDKNWKILDKIGEGQYGNVNKACLNKDCSYVFKWIQFIDNEQTSYNKNDAENEIKMQDLFYSFGVSPPVLESHICENGAFIIMPALQKTFYELLEESEPDKKKLEEIIYSSAELIERLNKKGYYHGYIHLNNIMTDGNRMYLIDTGYSSKIENEEDQSLDMNDFIDRLLFYATTALSYEIFLIQNAKKYDIPINDNDIKRFIYGAKLTKKQQEIYDKIKPDSKEVEKNKETNKQIYRQTNRARRRTNKQ